MGLFPVKTSEMISWVQTYQNNLNQEAGTLELDGTQIDIANKSCDDISKSLQLVADAKAALKKAYSYKRKVLNESKLNLASLSKTIKLKPNYTEAIGKSLGIENDSKAKVIPNVYKPQLKVETHPGYLLFKFVKKGVDGINLYTRLKGEKAWTKIYFYGYSPCKISHKLATEGLAENREYMAIGVLKDEEIGQQSDIISVAFAG